MLVKPMNKRILLEQVELEQKQDSLGFFQVEEKPKSFGDFYRVLDKSDDCAIVVREGQMISAEVVMPLGKINGKNYFICHENSIIATIEE